MAVRPVTFDSPFPVRDAAYREWRDADPEAVPTHGDAYDAGWAAAMEWAAERVQAVQDLLPEVDGPGDVAEELKALQRRMARTHGGS